jgi:uncharacterized membrane protein
VIKGTGFADFNNGVRVRIARKACTQDDFTSGEDKLMAESCVVGVYGSLTKAQTAAHILQRADFPARQVMLVGSAIERSNHMAGDLTMGDDSVHDAALGAGVGGLLGVLTGTAAGTLSGMGILLLAAPAAGALTGVVLGAFLGSLVGWGVHKSQIAHYEKYLKSGRALLIAEGDPIQVSRADEILRETDPIELEVHALDSSEAREILDSFR